MHLNSDQESKVKLVEQSKAKLWVRTAVLRVSHLMYQYRQAKARLESAEVSDNTVTRVSCRGGFPPEFSHIHIHVHVEQLEWQYKYCVVFVQFMICMM